MSLVTERLSATKDGIARAAELLRAGRLVAFATETVFGLGADATNSEAVAAIYTAKGRPSFNPLIAHVADLATAETIADFSDTARALAQAFWPGPMTLVLPLRSGAGVSSLVTAGLPTIALRVPALPLAQALLTEVGRPVAAPSANPSGKISPTRSDHVLAGLDGRIDAVLDGPPCRVGIESTIFGVSGDQIILLRPGAITPAMATQATGCVVLQRDDADEITAPGQLLSHYAPEAAITLDVTAPTGRSIHIGFGPGPCDLNLSPAGDLTEACAQLFDVLHRADALATAQGLPITVAPIPLSELGAALMDRLSRAAAPKI